MNVREASDDDIRAVFGNLDPSRAAEMTATAWHSEPLFLAHELILLRDQRNGRAPLFAHVDDDVPEEPVAAIAGVIPYGPGWGGMVWAATPRWPRVSFATHRWFHRVFAPEVLGRFRRVEFTALESDRISRAWLAGLGFTEEGIAYRQGKRGEDFVHFAWVNPDRTVGVVV
jgi:RimJ/RimL family protein N-acetyltransferase